MYAVVANNSRHYSGAKNVDYHVAFPLLWLFVEEEEEEEAEAL